MVQSTVMRGLAFYVGLLSACSFDSRGIAVAVREDHRVAILDRSSAGETARDLTPQASDIGGNPHADLALPCTTQSCAGCCSGNTCHPGNVAGLCGKGGESCIDCNFTAMICSAGVCTAPCASSGECGGDDVCIPPDCVSPYGRDYTVTILSADIGGKPVTGWWDVGSGPDPYCVAKLKGLEIHKTATVTDSSTPTWTNASFLARIEKGADLRIECYDDDGIIDDAIGSVVWSPEVPASVLKAGTVTVTGSSALDSLDVRFVPH